MNTTRLRFRLPSLPEPVARAWAAWRASVSPGDNPQAALLVGLLILRALVVGGIVMRFVLNVVDFDLQRVLVVRAIRLGGQGRPDAGTLILAIVCLAAYVMYLIDLVVRWRREPQAYGNEAGLRRQWFGDTFFATIFYFLSRDVDTDLIFLFVLALIAAWQLQHEVSPAGSRWISRAARSALTVWALPLSVVACFMIALLATAIVTSTEEVDALSRAILKVGPPRLFLFGLLYVTLFGTYHRTIWRERNLAGSLGRFNQRFAQASNWAWLADDAIALRQVTGAQLCLVRLYYDGQPAWRIMVGPQGTTSNVAAPDERRPAWYQGPHMHGQLSVSGSDWFRPRKCPARGVHIASYQAWLAQLSECGDVREVLGYALVDCHKSLLVSVELINKAAAAASIFDGDDKRLLQAFGSQLCKRLDQAAFLQACLEDHLPQVRSVIPSLLLLRVLQTTVTELPAMLRVDNCGLVLFDRRAGHGRVVARFADGSIPSQWTIPWDGNPVIEALRKPGSQPLAIEALAEAGAMLDPAMRDWLISHGVRSMLLCGIYVGDKLVGTLGLDSHSRQRLFSPAMQALASAVANQIGMAIRLIYSAQAAEVARAHRGRQTRLMERWREQQRQPVANASEAEVLDRVAGILAGHPAEPDLIILIPPQTAQVVARRRLVRWGSLCAGQDELPRQDCQALWALAARVQSQGIRYWSERADVVAELSGTESRLARTLNNYLKREGIVAAAGLPLSVGGHDAGVLLYAFRSYQQFEPEQGGLSNEQTALELAAHYVASSLVNLTLMREHALRMTEAQAAELHDVLIQRLVPLGWDLSTAVQRLGREDREGALNKLDAVQAGLVSVTHQIRQLMSHVIRSPVAAQGLCGALHDMEARSTELGGPRLRCEIPARLENEPEVDVAHQLYRIAEEGVHNARRYSEAAWVELALRETPTALELVVVDTGVGFDPVQVRAKGDGHGLDIMRGRAKSIGASFDIDAAPGTGTRIRVVRPSVLMRPVAQEEVYDVIEPASHTRGLGG